MGVLLAWGPYLFETGAASFEELRDTFEGQWAEHKIFGRRPAAQYTGPGKNTVRIRGTIYPDYTGAGSLATIHALKGDVEAGTINQLVTGDGDVIGPWRCEKGERVDASHDTDGGPLKVSYDFDFARHEEPDGPVWSLWP